MSHKIVGFAHSENETNTQYIKNQLSYLEGEIEGLSTEFADETDSRLKRYCRHANRLPCLMIFKGDAKKAHIHAKLWNDKALDWAKSHIG